MSLKDLYTSTTGIDGTDIPSEQLESWANFEILRLRANLASTKQDDVIETLHDANERLRASLAEAEAKLDTIYEYQRDCEPAEREIWHCLALAGRR